MTDTKDVTGSLALCTKPGMRGCDDCSYRDQKDCVGNLMRDALELLKEQEPLTIRSGRIEEIYNYIAECPECGMDWAMWLPDKMRYCPGCGRAVKWDER